MFFAEFSLFMNIHISRALTYSMLYAHPIYSQHEEILEQRRALEDQKAETHLTEGRITELYEEMKKMRDAGTLFLVSRDMLIFIPSVQQALFYATKYLTFTNFELS